VDHIAWANDVQQILRVVGMRRVFHRVQVIEVAEEFIEPVDGGQELILVAKMIFAELAGGVALRFECSGNGAGFSGQSHRRTRLSDRGHAGADRQLAGDEVRATRCAACLGVVVREQHPFFGDLVEVRRLPGHHAPVIGADVPHADIVAHYDDDVGFLVLRLQGSDYTDKRGRTCQQGSNVTDEDWFTFH
jgi:hypothetical protein